MSPELTWPWLDTRAAVLAELDRYLHSVSRLRPGAATRCRPWTVSDVTATAGDGYRPPDEVIAALVVVWDRALGGVERKGDRWSAIRRASGR